VECEKIGGNKVPGVRKSSAAFLNKIIHHVCYNTTFNFSIIK